MSSMTARAGAGSGEVPGLQTALDARTHPSQASGHPYYFMIPGGQVFTSAPTS